MRELFTASRGITGFVVVMLGCFVAICWGYPAAAVVVPDPLHPAAVVLLAAAAGYQSWAVVYCRRCGRPLRLVPYRAVLGCVGGMVLTAATQWTASRTSGVGVRVAVVGWLAHHIILGALFWRWRRHCWRQVMAAMPKAIGHTCAAAPNGPGGVFASQRPAVPDTQVLLSRLAAALKVGHPLADEVRAAVSILEHTAQLVQQRLDIRDADPGEVVARLRLARERLDHAATELTPRPVRFWTLFSGLLDALAARGGGLGRLWGASTTRPTPHGPHVVDIDDLITGIREAATDDLSPAERVRAETLLTIAVVRGLVDRVLIIVPFSAGTDLARRALCDADALLRHGEPAADRLDLYPRTHIPEPTR